MVDRYLSTKFSFSGIRDFHSMVSFHSFSGIRENDVYGRTTDDDGRRTTVALLCSSTKQS